jgi:hypothetical protein
MTDAPRTARWGSTPYYPALFFAGWIVTYLTESEAYLNDLIRPLVIGLLIIVSAQAAASLLVRNRHLGALLVFIVGLVLLGMRPVALALLAALVVALVVAARMRKPMTSLPWGTPTRWLDVISAITLVLVVATQALAGELVLPEGGHAPAAASSRSDLPDIYVILLDGYPRSDTLSSVFDYDNEPFLDEMGSVGFSVSRRSHSNYNLTALTLASMMNMTHVADLPELAVRPVAPKDQFRALGRAIDHARALDALRALGYEIVAIPSPFSSVTPHSADRILSSGQMTAFEYGVLQEGALPNVLPELQRGWLIDQHRERIAATLARLPDLAAESSIRPRFIFAHLMTPHPPLEFALGGPDPDGWPCFPAHCSMWDGGQIYGDGAIAPIRDQVAAVNSMVINTARGILGASPRPPVILFFSDHGQRLDFNDPDEMLRSFFIASTPGHPALFPDDVTPVNVIPRLLNEYAGAELPMATEESYWVDLYRLNEKGPLALMQRTLQDP